MQRTLLRRRPDLARLALMALLAASGIAASSGLACSSPAIVAEMGPTVILISLDGTRPADLAAGLLPSLVALSERGARAEKLVPVFPTTTFPNHVSLATGVRPGRHGITNNRFFDPERGAFDRKDIPPWIEVEPIWSWLERRDIATASYYWVGSEGRWSGPDREGRAPRHWLPFDKKTPEAKKSEQILRWLDIPDPEERPRLITSWFHGADHASHVSGPGSPEVAESLREQEPSIAALVRGIEERGLWESTTLIFVSDHGMAEVRQTASVRGALSLAGLKADVTGSGGFASVYLREPEGPERERAQAEAIRAIRALGLEAYPRSQAPAELGLENPRFGDVVVLAPIGTAILPAGRALKGVHGYRSELPEMAALFVAAGRGVRQGSVLPAVRAIDVAPTVLELLDVEVPPWMEGRSMVKLLAGKQ